MKKPLSLSALQHQKRKIETEGFLSDCWIEKHKPGGTAKGDNTYYCLRSRQPMFDGKKSKYVKAEEVSHYRMLIANSRKLKKLNLQLEKLRLKMTTVEAMTSSESNEWYTPPHYIEMARQVMGTIDLDPASNEIAQAWIRATTYYTVNDDGLNQCWQGNVWLNPPYGSHTGAWVSTTVTHYDQNSISAAVLLVRPAVGSNWYQQLSKRFPRCEPDQRIKFINAKGQPQTSPVHGNAFFYLGHNRQRFADVFRQIGSILLPL